MRDWKREFVVMSMLCLAPLAARGLELVVPATPKPMGFACDVLGNSLPSAGQLYVIDLPGSDDPLAQAVPSLTEAGLVAEPGGRLAALLPAQKERAVLTAEPIKGLADRFKLEQVDEKSLKIWDGEDPIFVYNFGQITKDSVPESDHRRTRGCYIHPLWGPAGEVLTDDFPVDHYHHHGIFWAWPHVKIGDVEYDLWMYNKIEQRFVSWLHQQGGPAAAVLGVENGWFIGDRKVMEERVWIRTYPSTGSGRYIDFEFFWTPLEEMTLRGAEGKSYGGLTARFAPAPAESKRIVVPSGLMAEDLTEAHLAWADFTAQFTEAPTFSGLSIMIAPSHPDFPPTWLTRYYGALCVGWPGVDGKTFPAGKPFSLKYRLWVHSGGVSLPEMSDLFMTYGAGLLGPKAR